MPQPLPPHHQPQLQPPPPPNLGNPTATAVTHPTQLQELWERDFSDLRLEWDIPFRELGFYGVPYRSTAFVLPTVNCLVELTEMPFTVVTLADVEVRARACVGGGGGRGRVCVRVYAYM